MLSLLTSVLALAAVAQAAPVNEILGRDSFTAEAVHQKDHVRNGTASLLKAYLKFGLTPTKPMPAAFMHAIQKRQDGSATAIPANGVEYLVSTVVGGQTLNLDFDTGSADLWVFSSLLASASKTGHHIYSSAASATYKALSGYTWSIQYADGSGASGSVGTDTVKIGGTTVTAQAIELAKKVSSTFVSDSSDGLVGLAFSSINTVSPVQQKTFFQRAIPSLVSPLFCAYLPFNKNGAYNFGFIDTTRYTGTITYTSVQSGNGFWEFPSTSFKVGSTTYSSSGTGIADTGTTLILMSDTAVDTYYSKVNGATYDSNQGGYIFPCSATLPTLSFKIGSTAYATIPGSLLNFQAVDSTNCFGSLQSVGGGSQAIYGDVFFNAYYAVFDNTPKFGFAPIK